MCRFEWHSEVAFIFQPLALLWLNLANRPRVRCRGTSNRQDNRQCDCLSPTSLREQEKMELPAGFGVSHSMVCILHISMSVQVGLGVAARGTLGSSTLGHSWAALLHSAPQNPAPAAWPRVCPALAGAVPHPWPHCACAREHHGLSLSLYRVCPYGTLPAPGSHMGHSQLCCFWNLPCLPPKLLHEGWERSLVCGWSLLCSREITTFSTNSVLALRFVPGWIILSVEHSGSKTG